MRKRESQWWNLTILIEKPALHRQNNGLPIFFQLQKLNRDHNEELVQSPESCLMQERFRKKISFWTLQGAVSLLKTSFKCRTFSWPCFQINSNAFGFRNKWFAICSLKKSQVLWAQMCITFVNSAVMQIYIF